MTLKVIKQDRSKYLWRCVSYVVVRSNQSQYFRGGSSPFGESPCRVAVGVVEDGRSLVGTFASVCCCPWLACFLLLVLPSICNVEQHQQSR